jgi:hypothetical protein
VTINLYDLFKFSHTIIFASLLKDSYPSSLPPVRGKYAVDKKAFAPKVNNVTGASSPLVTITAPVALLNVTSVTCL